MFASLDLTYLGGSTHQSTERLCLFSALKGLAKGNKALQFKVDTGFIGLKDARLP